MSEIITTRRAFLATTGLAVAAASTDARFGLNVRAGKPAHGLVIRGGTIFDGSGAEGRVADMAVSAGRITEISARIVGAGDEEIDARGLAVTPGFLDIHSHGDSSLLEDPRAESAVRQGITTIVAGADGSSRFLGTGAQSFTAWAEKLEAVRPGVNVAAMIGLGSVRGAVIGDDDEPASSDALAKMVRMVEQAVAAGACGASTGLEYTPGAFARPDELIALCRPLAAKRLPYATHMRNEDDNVLVSINESIAVARGAGCPLQISHLKMQGTRNWPKLDRALARIAAARGAGVDVQFDVYPYEAYSTGLTNLFPVWSRDGGTDAFLARFRDSAVAPRIRTEALAKVELIGGWDNVQISRVSEAVDRDAEGKRLGAYAKAKGLDPYVAAQGLLERHRGDVGMLGFAMSEETIDRLLAHEFSMVCSDGGAFAIDGPTRRGSPHPRGAGTFPRVLSRYVRERKALTFASAIRKMTAVPAARVHLNDRGRLAIGMAADVSVLDAGTITDVATFANPFQYPIGITAVVVNGVISVREGTRPSAGAGQILRPT